MDKNKFSCLLLSAGEFGGNNMDNANKQDMSNTCGFKDSEMHYKAGKEITYEEHEKWYKDNCDQCIYACDICMYGEE